MEFKVELDESKIKKNLTEKLSTDAQSVVNQTINEFFSQNTQHFRDNKGELTFKVVKGAGRLEIEDMVANKFLDEEFKKKMNDYFEKNWERVFEDCMTKALQHKANAVVFAKTKEIE